MGRWGLRLFEKDEDLEIAFHLSTGKYLGVDMNEWKFPLNCMVFHNDRHAPMEAEEFYKTRRYRNTLHESIIPYLRHKLDGNGLGELLISLCRAKESRVDGLFPGPYYTIILGALMMRAGAEISQDNIQHLWDLMTQITKYRVWKLPAFPRDFQGLWSPGRAQFIVALIFYRAGVARSFADESCFGCGFVQRDFQRLGVLKRIEKCECLKAWYCSQKCREIHWPVHKKWCLRPENIMTFDI